MLISKSKKIFKLLAVIIVLPLICSCKASSYKTSFFAMDTVMEISVFGENCEKIGEMCEDEVIRLEKIFSAESGELRELNDKGAKAVSDELVDIINASLNYSELTDYAFDIRLRELTELWGFNKDEQSVPQSADIEKAIDGISNGKISINGKSVVLDGVKLDLGAIAKGYTSARLSEICKNNGITSALIYLGGNVRVVGRKSDGSLWNVGIRNPFDENKLIGTVSVEDTAVITSGGYQRYFEENGTIYHHILDGKTGYPADNGLSSVTIISSDDVLADAFSTAIYVGGAELAEKLYSEVGNFEYILVDENGNITVSNSDKINFTEIEG